ncbi:MAG: AraC family transcriptional regulator [Planctomycetota bacterium]
MPEAAVTAETRRRVLDAALAAERDLAAELTVDALADAVDLAPKHFHRAFRAVVGEPPQAYLRRIRLQQAAYLLKWSELSIVEVAVRFGYATHAGFTKAFAAAYGYTPAAFRAASGVTPYMRVRPGAKGADRVADLEPAPLSVRIEEVPDRRVAAMRHVGPAESCASVWRRMAPWARERGLLGPDAIVLGVHNDYWDAASEDRYRYDAAVVVPDRFEAPDDVNTFVLPGGPVAMAEFAGSVAEMDTAWRRLADLWLPASGRIPRTTQAYDRYPVDLVSGGPLRRIVQMATGVRATLCLPVTG